MIIEISFSPFICSARSRPFGAITFPLTGRASSRFASLTTSPAKSLVAPRQMPPAQNAVSVPGISRRTFRSKGSGYVGATTESRTIRSTVAGMRERVGDGELGSVGHAEEADAPEAQRNPHRLHVFGVVARRIELSRRSDDRGAVARQRCVLFDRRVSVEVCRPGQLMRPDFPVPRLSNATSV